MISVIDYGAGNLRSISNALLKAGAKIEVVSDKLPSSPDALVLPGVGNFGDAMEKLSFLRQELMDTISTGTPFLGLCLGQQVLFEGSEEAPGLKGLGILPGTCKRFSPNEVPGGKVPHMGWNRISLQSSCPLFEGMPEKESFYFVHSYYAPLGEYTIADCGYGVGFSAAVRKGNIYACQFHPERSGKAGLKLLENFLKIVKR